MLELFGRDSHVETLVQESFTIQTANQVAKRLDLLDHQANGRWHVTADLVKRTMRLKASTRIVQERLHKHGINFKTRGSEPSAVEHRA